MIWDDAHARLRADMVDAVDALDRFPVGTSLWVKAVERALAAYDACLYDVERLHPERERTPRR